jgi:hypothetical protein
VSEDTFLKQVPGIAIQPKDGETLKTNSMATDEDEKKGKDAKEAPKKQFSGSDEADLSRMEVE